jgi:glycosyltransferase involved in cell wall biosynthesis
MLADGMLCYDQEMAEKLSQRFPKKWTSAAPNSTDGAPIAAARRALAREGRVGLRRRHGLHRQHYLVGVGRMIQKKEFHRLPAILRRVMAQIQDVGLILVGDGPARTRIESEVGANDLILGQDVHFVGDVWEPAALTEWVFCADVNVSPGYVGLAAVDSLFAGVPVVISRPTASGPYHSPEWKYLRDGPGGLIASDGTDAAIAQRVIDYFRESEARRREREDACVQFAEERLGIALPVQRLMELARGVPAPSESPLEAVSA